MRPRLTYSLFLFGFVCWNLVFASGLEASGKARGVALLEELENALVALAEKVRPSVVNLSPYVPPSPSVRTLGSSNKGRPTNSAAGVIIDGDKGLIVTNSHVVRDAEKIQVKLLDGKKFIGQVIARDEDTDLALVKIDSEEPLPSVQLADSSKVKVGQLVVAVGNPYGLNDTLSFGVVSGMNRENINLSRYEDFIQTDASINPGNSGGPLLNIRGEVIGINTAIINYAQNIGFAIPSNMVQLIISDLLAYGEVRRGWMGVGIEPVTDEIARLVSGSPGKGVYVNASFKGNPAYEAGIRKGDVILKIGGAPVKSPSAMIRMIGSIHPGQKVNVEVLRDGELKSFSVELGRKMGGKLFAFVPDILEDLGFKVVESSSVENKFQLADRDGLIVTQIIPDSPADKGGVVLGDLIVSVNGENITTRSEFQKFLKSAPHGKTVDLSIIRDQKSLELNLPVGN